MLGNKKSLFYLIAGLLLMLIPFVYIIIDHAFLGSIIKSFSVGSPSNQIKDWSLVKKPFLDVNYFMVVLGFLTFLFSFLKVDLEDIKEAGIITNA
jgi:hypothetical protein